MISALEYFNNECAYCGVSLKGDYASVFIKTKDHVVPRSRNGNITVPCCLRCNSLKSDKSLENWYYLQDFYSDKRHQKIIDYITKIKKMHNEKK